MANADLPAGLRPGARRRSRPDRDRAAAGGFRRRLVGQPVRGDGLRLRGDARRGSPGLHLPHGLGRAGRVHRRPLRGDRGDRGAAVPGQARLDRGPVAEAPPDRGHRPRGRPGDRGRARRRRRPAGRRGRDRLVAAARPRPGGGGGRARPVRGDLAQGQPGRPGHADLHLGHHRHPQGRHAHAPERALHPGRLAPAAPAGGAVRPRRRRHAGLLPAHGARHRPPHRPLVVAGSPGHARRTARTASRSSRSRRRCTRPR